MNNNMARGLTGTGRNRMRKFDKYKQNLCADKYNIYSYNTLVAKISHKHKTVRPLDHWSSTTSKHVNYVASELGYKVVKK